MSPGAGFLWGFWSLTVSPAASMCKHSNIEMRINVLTTHCLMAAMITDETKVKTKQQPRQVLWDVPVRSADGMGKKIPLPVCRFALKEECRLCVVPLYLPIAKSVTSLCRPWRLMASFDLQLK